MVFLVLIFMYYSKRSVNKVKRNGWIDRSIKFWNRFLNTEKINIEIGRDGKEQEAKYKKLSHSISV